MEYKWSEGWGERRVVGEERFGVRGVGECS